MSKPSCRSCGAVLSCTVIDLGDQPLSNAFVVPGREAEERVYPLHARFCSECFLVQVDDVVPPADIFEDYAYFSSVSESWVEHARTFVESATGRLGLGADSLVVEVASNDGYLLRHFVERSVPVLGVEPAANVAAAAVEHGVRTLNAFFGLDTAHRIVAEHGEADLVVANNVFAHVPDINDFVAGLAVLLAPAGTLTIEVPHLLELIGGVQFDTIYHEHFSYFSLLAASIALGRHGLEVVDVHRLTTHGGSLRIEVAHRGAGRPRGSRVEEVLAAERAALLDRPDGFALFAERAEACRDSLTLHLESAKRRGRLVVGYGAAAKGNTLLNFAGVTSDLLPFVADRSPHKQGRLLPGSHVPIVHPDEIARARPAEVLVLPWNLHEEIIGQLSHVRSWGGRFVIAVPLVQELP